MIRDIIDTFGAAALGCFAVGVIGVAAMVAVLMIWGCG